MTGTCEKLVPGLPCIIACALGPGPAGKDALTILRIIHRTRNWPDETWPKG